MNTLSQAPRFSNLRLVLSVTTTLLLVGTASATVIQGTVSCRETVPPTPFPDVTVIAAGASGNHSGVTDANGNYSISFSVGAPELYQVHLQTLPPGMTFVDPAGGTNLVLAFPGDTVPNDANFVLAGCGSTPPPPAGEIGGLVWEDLNCDGIRDWSEPVMDQAVEVKLNDCDGTQLTNTWTDANGEYRFSELEAGDYSVQFVAPPGYEFSPTNQDNTADPETGATICFMLQSGETNLTWDAGLCRLEAPGVRSQGYWKNHPDAWPVDEIEIGGVTYDKAEAILLMQLPTKGDKWLNLFEQLVAAKLNVLVGNEADCIDGTILFADMWLEDNPGPVQARSSAWKNGGAYFLSELDAYNNGCLCAPSAED